MSAETIAASRNPLRSRLARRIVLLVIVAIAVIETTILVPSYLRHRANLFEHFAEQVRTATLTIVGTTSAAVIPEWQEVGRSLMATGLFLGVGFYDHDGALIGAMGEPPSPKVMKAHANQSPHNLISADGSRYDVAISAADTHYPNDIAVRVDSSSVAPAMTAYLLRIGGLVLLISVFVAAATILVIHYFVMRPLLALHDSLVAARGDIRQAETYMPRYQRSDEIGDMAQALGQLLDEVAAARHHDLSASEQRFQDFADSASDFYWEMDERLRFSYFSDRFGQITGVAPDELLGRTRQETGIPGVDPVAWRQHLDDLASHRPFRGFAHPRTLDDGRVVWLSINGKPIFDADGRFTGYRGIGSDITETIEAEQALIEAKDSAEAASRSKSEFLARMSHELRTPLNAILGFSEVIRERLFGPVGDSRYVQYADDINRSGRQLLALINDLLDLSRIETGRYELHEERVDVAALIDECLGMVDRQAREAGIDLHKQVATGLPGLVADQLAVRQILTNLLTNALKFTPAPGRVEVYAVADASGLELAVADTGVGIAPEDIDRVLEPFSQVSNSYVRQQDGVGLGLAIVHSLIDLHGGTINIESELGAGTRISVRFPPARIETDRSAAKA